MSTVGAGKLGFTGQETKSKVFCRDFYIIRDKKKRNIFSDKNQNRKIMIEYTFFII